MERQAHPVTFELKHGTRITVRRATLEDVPAIEAYFRALSGEAHARRFESARAQARGSAAKMVDVDELLIALDASGSVIGEALFEPDPFDDPARGDWAAVEMSVAEQWEWCDVRTKLLVVLTGSARAASIRRLVIDIRGGDGPMIAWATSPEPRRTTTS